MARTVGKSGRSSKTGGGLLCLELFDLVLIQVIYLWQLDADLCRYTWKLLVQGWQQ